MDRTAYDWVVTGPTDGLVEAWSSVRLPFQPRGTALELRNELRNRIRQFATQAGSGYSLTAGYTSNDRTPGVDVENVLLYNVGPSYFGFPSRVAIERRYHDPPEPPVEGAFLHHHRYQVGMFPISSWSAGDPICIWHAPLLWGEQSLSAVAPIWYSIRSTTPLEAAELLTGKPFVLMVVVIGPDIARRSLPSMTKCVVDGAICALHVHDGSDLVELSNRVAAKLNLSPREVAGKLLTSTPSPLGSRRLLWRFGKNVQWNPGDDLCVWASIDTVEGPDWELMIMLGPVEPATS
jgi:hypothetical protein